MQHKTSKPRNLKKTHPIDDTGAVLVMTALFLTVLLGFSALVIDIGLLYINRLALVNAVDAAALAGVQELPYSPTMAIESAKLYATTNGADKNGLSVLVQNGDHEVKVTASKDVELHLARLFGMRNQQVTASATARVGSISAYVGVAPFGVVKQDFIYGEQYTLKHGPYGDSGRYHGNFGALALGGRGADHYRENIRHGHQARLAVGDWVDTETGNMAGPTVKGVKYRIDECQHYPKCTWDKFVPGCSRLIVVPVIRTLEEVNGRDSVEIVGFAAFFLEGTVGGGGNGQGSESAVVGRFLRTVLPGELGDAGNYGLRGYKLVN